MIVKIYLINLRQNSTEEIEHKSAVLAVKIVVNDYKKGISFFELLFIIDHFLNTIIWVVHGNSGKFPAKDYPFSLA